MANGQDSANPLDAVYGAPSSANPLDAVYAPPKENPLDSVYASAATQPQPTFHQWRLNNKRILPTTPEEQDAEGNPTYASVPSQSQATAPTQPETGVWAGVKRNTVGMAQGLYHAFTDPATPQEKTDLLAKLHADNAKGDNIPEDYATNPSRGTLAIHRLLTNPGDLLGAKSDQQLQTAKNLWDSGAHWDAANLSVTGAVNKVLSAIPIAGPMVNAIAERAEGSLVPMINEQGQRIAPENIPASRKDISGAGTDVAALVAAENIPNFIKGKLTGRAAPVPEPAAGAEAAPQATAPAEPAPTAPAPAPVPAAAEYKPLNVSEPTKGKVFYHGTRNPEFTDIEQAQPSKSAPTNLLGPGFYMTDNPEVAGRYGQLGNVLQGKLGQVKLIDMEAPADPRLVAGIKAVLPEAEFTAVQKAAGANAKGKDLYSAFRNHVIAEHGGDVLPDYQVDLSHELLTKGTDGFRYEGTKLGTTKDNAIVLFPDTVNGATLGETGKLGAANVQTEIGRPESSGTRQGAGATVAGQPNAAPTGASLSEGTRGRTGPPSVGQAATTLPPEVAQRIAQNAETLKPIVDPEKIASRDDVGKQLDQAASVLQRNPDPRMSGPLSFAEQQRLAADLGMKPEDLLGSKPGQAFSAEEVVAARSMLEASTTRVMNAARMAATGDPAYQSQFLESLARHQEIQQTITERVATEAGRALGAFRNAPREGTIQAAVDQLSKLDDAARLEAAQRLAKIDPNDAAAIAKFTREITPSSTAEKLYEAWMNGILSGGTAIVKGASDVAMRTLGVATRTVSPAVDFIRSALTGEPRERFFGEIPADLYGMTRGASKALAQFSDTFFHEKGMGEGPLDTGFRTAAIKGPLGRVVRTPTRALEAVTDAAKIVNYSADIHAQAYRQAASEGLSGADLLTRAEQLAAEPTPEMRARAGQYGKEQTFQQKLGPAGQWVMEGRNKANILGFPVGKYALPFIKTPANILKAAVDYSPVGLVRTARQAVAGKLLGGQLSDALAKNSIGTAIAGATIYHALQGNITGSGPASSNDRLRLESQGWQPYSMKVGNRFVSYRKLEPIGTVMGMAADVAEAVRSAGPASGPAAGNFTKTLVSKIRTNLDSAEFIGSLMRITQLFESPGKYARSMAGTVIPTAVADVAKATDRTVRTPDTNAPLVQQVGQQLESRIPGLTQNVPALIGPNRQPIQRPASAVGGFFPYPVSTAGPGLSAAEMQQAQELRRRQLVQAHQALVRNRSKPGR